MTGRRRHDERGQALTEYLMIVGFLTAMIISLTAIIVPGLSLAVFYLVRAMAVYLTSVPG